MHGDLDDVLRRGERLAAPVAALTACALAVNLAGGATVSLWLAGGALAALALIRGAFARAAPILAAGAATAALTYVVARLAGDPAIGARTAARVVAGAAWLGLLVGHVPWTSLRRALARVRVPEAWLESLEVGVAHAGLLGRDLASTRAALLVRAGRPGGVRDAGLYAAMAIERAIDRRAGVLESATMRAVAAGPAAPRGAAGLRLDDASVRGDHGAARLDRVSLRLPAGAWCLVAGASGSGKTTLLRLAAGLIPADGGVVERFGRAVPGPGSRLARRVDARVALVGDDPAEQLVGATPVEDVVWGLRRRGVPPAEAEARAHLWLDHLGIAHLAGRPVFRLSHGERKRVVFAAALATEPDLLLCDEPTSGLDPANAGRLLRRLAALAARRPLTVLWASHELDRLPAPIDRAVLLAGGRVVGAGPLRDTLTTAALRRGGLVDQPEDEKEEDTVLLGFKQDAAAPRQERIRQIKAWVGELVAVPEGGSVMVTELSCHELGCPPLETVIAVLHAPGDRAQAKLPRGLFEVTREELAALAPQLAGARQGGAR